MESTRSRSTFISAVWSSTNFFEPNLAHSPDSNFSSVSCSHPLVPSNLKPFFFGLLEFLTFQLGSKERVNPLIVSIWGKSIHQSIHLQMFDQSLWQMIWQIDQSIQQAKKGRERGTLHLLWHVSCFSGAFYLVAIFDSVWRLCDWFLYPLRFPTLRF